MDNDFLSFALKNTLDQVEKVCPEVKTVFALDDNLELMARGENTPENTLARAIELLRELIEKADALGGAEDIVLDSTEGRVVISHMDEIYLITVTSKEADPKYVSTVTRVLVPTILKLLERLTPAPLDRSPSRVELEPQTPAVEEAEQQVGSIEESTAETIETEGIEEPEEYENHEETDEIAETEQKSESSLPEPPVNQFIVEDIKGLLTPTDVVRIDNSVLERWTELYAGRNIEEADLETFAGKSLRCKVKPIKDGKLEGQGKIQIPTKLQDVLDIKKGELVRVKPAIE